MSLVGGPGTLRAQLPASTSLLGKGDDASYFRAAPTSQLSTGAAFMLHCFVQFVYNTGTAAHDSNNNNNVDFTVPFTEPTPAAVEVFSDCLCVASAAPTDLTAARTESTREVEWGLQIRPLATTSQSSSADGITYRKETESQRNSGTTVWSRWDAACRGANGALPAKSLHQSVVRAIHRAPREGETREETSITLQAGLPASSNNLGEPRLDTTASLWLPFSRFSSLDWSFRGTAATNAARSFRLIGGSDPVPARSSTPCGVSESQSNAVVHLRCVPGTAAEKSPRVLESVLLHELTCTDALALADAFDAIKQQRALEGINLNNCEAVPSAVQPLQQTAAAIFVDSSTDLFLLEKGESKLPHQRTFSPPLQANGSAVKGNVHVAALYGNGTPLLPSTAAPPHTLMRSLTLYQHNHGRSSGGNGNDTSKTTRSISFTDVAGTDRSPATCPHNAKGQIETLSLLQGGEATAYSKYVQMLGMGHLLRLSPPPSRYHNSTSGYSPTRCLPSLASYGDSFGSGLTSAVCTPLGGALQFPHRGNNALSHTSPDEESGMSFQDGLPSEPLESVAFRPHQHHHNFARLSGRGREAEGREHMEDGEEVHCSLPGVVETSTVGDAPRWFPAAPELSDVSEVTVPSTKGSGIGKTHATLRAFRPTLHPHESQLGNFSAHVTGQVLRAKESERAPIHTIAPVDRCNEKGNTTKQPDLVFPSLSPLLSSSQTRSSSSSSLSCAAVAAAVVNMEAATEASSQYLTPKQRQTIDFDQLLRPTKPPSSTSASASAAAEAASFGVPQPESVLTHAALQPELSSSLRIPAALDQILLELRMSSLPVTSVTPAPLAINNSTTATSRTTKTQTSNVASSSATSLRITKATVQPPGQGQLQPPSPKGVLASLSSSNDSSPPASLISSAVLSPRDSTDVNAQDAAAVSPTAGSSHIVSSYSEILQQMRDRKLHSAFSISRSHTIASATTIAPGAEPSTQLTTTARTASPSHTTSSNAAAAPSVSIASTDTDAYTRGESTVQAGPVADGDDRGFGRGGAVPQRAHGPFAQPSQHPPCTFLAHGSHRASASPPSSPHRMRCRLSSPALTSGVATTITRASTSSAGAVTAQPVRANRTRSVNEKLFNVQTNSHDTSAFYCVRETNEASLSLDSSALSPPSLPWRSARTWQGRATHSPQSPMQMLPRRPEPLIGTPKLALHQAAGSEPPSPSMTLGNSSLEEFGKASSTSMAT